LYLLQLGARSLERLTRTQAEESTPAFSPDGQRIAYSADVGNDAKSLFEYSLKTKASRRLTSEPGVSDLAPHYSPDGSRIVFSRAHEHRRYSMGGWTWDDWDVCLIQADGSSFRRLTAQKSRTTNGAQFVKGGRAVVFSAGGRTDRLTPELYELPLNDAADSVPHPLEDVPEKTPQHGAWADEPNVSNDATMIAFLSDRQVPFEYDIYVMSLDRKTPVALHVTTLARYNQNPRFSADGKSVYFLAGTEQNWGNRAIYSLWRVNVTDGKLNKIADSDLFTSPARWRPRD
jgi:Tol biopolymer transport system component